MRVLRLDLFAFGTFSNAKLDFSAKPSALQLVYGPNEAGKSTTLRALLALLYGIPARTADAHQHDMTRLRIGATLEGDDGAVINVVRRKGLKQTLLDKDGQPLPERTLSDLLSGLDEALFRNMFGLDHERLREGAEALLTGGGHVGEGLFDASVGSQALSQVKQALHAEADELYKARGKTPKLNVVLEALREKSRKKKDAILSPSTYVEQTRALTQKQAQRTEALARRRDLLAERARLTRDLQLLPLLSRHEQLSAARQALLARGAGGATTMVGSDLLEEQLRDLERRYGVWLSAEGELPQLATELAALEREIPVVTARLGSLSIPERPIDTPLRTRLRKLSAEQERASQRILSLAEAEATLEQERELLDRRVREHTPEVDVQGLRTLLAAIDDEDLVAVLARTESELTKRGAIIARALSQLGVPVSLEELASLRLPEERALSEIEGAQDALAAELARCATRRETSALRLSTLKTEIAALLSQGELLSPQLLTEARGEREASFVVLSAALLDAQSLPEAPEKVQRHQRLVEHADQLSDRLRSEATRLSELSRLRNEQALLEAEAQACSDRAVAIAAELRELEGRLGDELRPSHLASSRPRDIRQSLLKLEALRAQAVGLSADQAAYEKLLARASALSRELDQALLLRGCPEPHHSLAHSVASARAFCDRLQERERETRLLLDKRRELEGRSTALQRQRHEAETAREVARQRFHEELSHAGLHSALAPDELLACLDDIGLSFELREKVERLRSKRAALAEAGDALRTDVAALVARHVPSAAELPLAEQLLELSRAQRVERESIRDSERLKADLAALSEELSRLSDGDTLDLLKQHARSFSPSAVRARLFEIEASLTTLEDELSDLEQQLGRLDAGLATLNDSPFAVAIAEEVEAELSSARALLRRYLEVRVSLSLLAREVERYRREHQGPLLTRASALFARLTLHNYEGLEAELDERDQPVLSAIHKSSRCVRIAGLSDGTRDQLYLALRIASLERFVANGRALPLVLDDAFIHFDDKRAEAALSVLGELSQTTQVLFFTHHARMVELAKRALTPARVALHELDPVRGTVSFRDDGPLFARV